MRVLPAVTFRGLVCLLLPEIPPMSVKVRVAACLHAHFPKCRHRRVPAAWSGDLCALAGERFVQQRVGLHHLCLRARSREDVDRCAALLKEMDATIVRGPMEGSWAPGYYYVLFEDPDGIRLEVNFVPGAGLLADGAQFNPATGYV